MTDLGIEYGTDYPDPLEPPPEDDGRKEKKSAATVLVDLAEELYEFGVSTDSEAFGVPRSGAKVVLLLRGGHTSLRKQLAREYRRRYGKVAPAQALTDALTTLEGFAEESEPQRLWPRVGQHDGARWLDLGDHTGRAVRITAEGWSVVDRPPVLFRRTALTGPLPVPVPGGDLSELWEWLTTVDPADRPLLLAELVDRLTPDHPHVILDLSGEQGSAKSTVARVCTELIDPSPVPLRKPPKDADSWVTAAAGSWVVTLDNLSHLPDWLSDSLCRASTGEGDVRRKLYTDGELATFAFRRCITMTSIDLGALNGDLADRVLSIRLRTIDPDTRINEEALWPRWHDAHPRLLGALLDLAASTIAALPSVELATKPRMADYATTLAAVDQVLGTEGFARYMSSDTRTAAEALTADRFVATIAATLDGPWTGTAGELLDLVTPEKPPKGWPATARAVTQRLHRQAPVMRKAGWTVTDLGSDNKHHATIWSLETPRDRTSPSSPSSPSDKSDTLEGMSEMPEGELGEHGEHQSPGVSSDIPAAVPRGDPCSDPTHTPRLHGDRWRCPDCEEIP